MKLLLAIMLASITAASTAHAEGCPGAHDAMDVVRHIFDMADRDQDGLLSAAEYEGGGLERYGVSFEESDTDGDGTTSLDEYLALYERHHPPLDGSEA